jgi:hypothetical protein
VPGQDDPVRHGFQHAKRCRRALRVGVEHVMESLDSSATGRGMTGHQRIPGDEDVGAGQLVDRVPRVWPGAGIGMTVWPLTCSGWFS